MAGLQRSVVSFRRQGSSGLVWDDKLVSQELSKTQRLIPEGGGGSSRPAVLKTERSQSDGGRGGFRTVKVTPAIEPPSPRVSACGCCAFAKDKKTRRGPPTRGRRVV